MTRVLTPLPVLLPLLGRGADLGRGHHPAAAARHQPGRAPRRLGGRGGAARARRPAGTAARSPSAAGRRRWASPSWSTGSRRSCWWCPRSCRSACSSTPSGRASRRRRAPRRCRSSSRRYLVLSAGVCNAFLAGDLFNLYVGFEVLLAASFVLLTLGGTGDRGARRHHLRGGQPAVVAALPRRHRARLRGDRHAQHGPALRAAGRAARADAHRCSQFAAAGRVRDQGGGVPAVDLAARLLPDRAGAGHRGVRRPADQGRCLRDHPHTVAAVPRRRAATTCCCRPRC